MKKNIVTLLLLVLTGSNSGLCQKESYKKEYCNLISEQLNEKLNKDYLNFYYSINSDTIKTEFNFIVEQSDSSFFTNLLEGKQFASVDYYPPDEGSSWKYKNFEQLKIYIIATDSTCIGVICPSGLVNSTLNKDINLSGVDSRFLFFLIKDGKLEFEI